MRPAPASDIFLIGQSLEMFEGDDLPTRRQNWDTSINDFARRVACTSGEFFGGLKHVVINVESGSHTKGAIEP